MFTGKRVSERSPGWPLTSADMAQKLKTVDVSMLTHPRRCGIVRLGNLWRWLVVMKVDAQLPSRLTYFPKGIGLTCDRVRASAAKRGDEPSKSDENASHHNGNAEKLAHCHPSKSNEAQLPIGLTSELDDEPQDAVADDERGRQRSVTLRTLPSQ
jgi:hypothetical protein